MKATLIIHGESQILSLQEAERKAYALTSQGYESVRQQSSLRLIIEVYK